MRKTPGEAKTCSKCKTLMEAKATSYLKSSRSIDGLKHLKKKFKMRFKKRRKDDRLSLT